MIAIKCLKEEEEEEKVWKTSGTLTHRKAQINKMYKKWSTEMSKIKKE